MKYHGVLLFIFAIALTFLLPPVAQGITLNALFVAIVILMFKPRRNEKIPPDKTQGEEHAMDGLGLARVEPDFPLPEQFRGDVGRQQG